MISNYTYCKIKKLLCKLGENLKQTNKSPSIAKAHYGEPKAKALFFVPISQSPWGNLIPRKRLKQQKNKQDPAPNLPQQSFTTMKPLGASSIIKFPFLTQVDVERNISSDSAQKRLLQNCLVKHNYEERKERFNFIFPLLMAMPQGTERRYFVFTAAIYWCVRLKLYKVL